jgi:hypothetical protein
MTSLFLFSDLGDSDGLLSGYDFLIPLLTCLINANHIFLLLLDLLMVAYCLVQSL